MESTLVKSHFVSIFYEIHFKLAFLLEFLTTGKRILSTEMKYGLPIFARNFAEVRTKFEFE